jgi:hypothetical protein
MKDPDVDHYPDEITRQVADLREQIAQSPPTSLASAAIKLRDLLHPELGWPDSERPDHDIPSLRQILAFLDTEIAERGQAASIPPRRSTMRSQRRLLTRSRSTLRRSNRVRN